MPGYLAAMSFGNHPFGRQNLQDILRRCQAGLKRYHDDDGWGDTAGAGGAGRIFCFSLASKTSASF